jgi:hypothetical protein
MVSVCLSMSFILIYITIQKKTWGITDAQLYMGMTGMFLKFSNSIKIGPLGMAKQKTLEKLHDIAKIPPNFRELTVNKTLKFSKMLSRTNNFGLLV